jgi:hypothetical protein
MKQTILTLVLISVFAQLGHAQLKMGFELARSRDFQYGSLGVADPTAGANGLGFGYMVSATSEFPLTPLWSLRFHSGLRAQRVNGVYENPRATSETEHLTAWGQVGLSLFQGFVLALGPDCSYLLASSVQTSTHSIQTIADPNQFTAGVVTSLGYDINIGSIIATPSASYDHMMTSLSDAGSLGFRIGSLYCAVGMKFKVD